MLIDTEVESALLIEVVSWTLGERPGVPIPLRGCRCLNTSAEGSSPGHATALILFLDGTNSRLAAIDAMRWIQRLKMTGAAMPAVGFQSSLMQRRLLSGEGRGMAKLEGTITLAGLPPHRGLIVSLCFYRVEAADAPEPFGGDPPAEAATDCHEVAKEVDLNAESSQAAYELPFRIEKSIGFYFVQVRAILFRTQDGKVFAQAEKFFFGRRPVQVASEPEGKLTLPVAWPTQGLEELDHLGTVSPQSKRPWWRFW